MFENGNPSVVRNENARRLIAGFKFVLVVISTLWYIRYLVWVEGGVAPVSLVPAGYGSRRRTWVSRPRIFLNVLQGNPPKPTNTRRCIIIHG